MSDRFRRAQKPFVVLKKFVVGWALIAGMAVFALLAGAKRLAQWPQRDETVPATEELPGAQPQRLGGADGGVDSRSD